MTGKQVIFEFACPLLLLVFVQKAQIPKIVGVTEAMLTLRLLTVEAVSIMFTDPVELRQDAYLVSGLLAPVAMDRVMGKLISTSHMHPMQHSLYSYSRLIISDDIGF